ncbi:MAG: YbaN family protein [Methanocellales archaeon]|nr:YbaN family protein [Methanocellales archaeon]MDD3291662.1 YbaN family protein [Methanocellales archaeon]MDD5485445.1 YbaN family protein [Methanocellales archaeon]
MRNFKKIAFTILGSACTVLGLIGIIVPLLPTTPLLLLAAFFYGKSSHRLQQWLFNNRVFGSYLTNYVEGRGISRRNKIYTLTFLWLAIGYSIFFIISNFLIRALLFLIAICVTLHILTIKTINSKINP